MNTFVITFAGIMVFIRLGTTAHDPRHLLIPLIKNVSYHNKRVSDHQAYIAIPQGKADHSTWGAPDRTKGIAGVPHELFYLRGEELTINAADTTFDASAQQALVPSLKTWCAGYTLASNLSPAATIDIDKGVLTAKGNIPDDEAVVSKLAVKVDGPLIIGVKGSQRRLVIQPGTNIRFENTEPDAMRTHNHFLAYYAMSQDKACDESHFPGSAAMARMAKMVKQGKARGRDKGYGADCSNSQYP